MQELHRDIERTPHGRAPSATCAPADRPPNGHHKVVTCFAAPSIKKYSSSTESSFPIELAGVSSTIELGAAHFQLSSTQLDPIPETFIVKRLIPVCSAKVI